MSRYEILNNVDHADLRVRIDRHPDLGDRLWYTPTFAAEFRNLQRCYPIVFIQNEETRKMQPVALLGFEAGENLFVDESGWHAPYIPLSIVRQPFLIGFQESHEAGEEAEPVISVDMESPRVSSDEGEAVFLEHGGNSEYLEQVTSILQVLLAGSERNSDFADFLQGMNLLEPFVLEVQLDSGADHRLSGFYTVNEDALKALTGDDLVILNNNDYLEPVYMAIASMSNLPTLVDLKNRRQAGQGTDG